MTSEPPESQAGVKPTFRTPSPPGRPRFGSRLSFYALLGASAYAFGALVWIYSSDTLLRILFNSPGDITRFQIVKGTAFVVFTALALYWLLNGLFARIERAESASARLARSQSEILDNLPDPVLLLDGEGRIEALNTLGRHILGDQRAAYAVGVSILDFMTEDSHAAAGEALAHAGRGENRTFRCNILTRDGSRPFDVHARPLTAPDGTVAQIIVIARDRAEERPEDTA